MTPAWAHVKLRVAFGDVPEPYSVLRMATGRRYQVLKTVGRSLHCIVLPVDHKTGDAPVLDWRWAPRKRKASK